MVLKYLILSYFLPMCCMCGLVYEKPPNTSSSISFTTASSTDDNWGASFVNSGSKLLAALADRYIITKLTHIINDHITYNPRNIWRWSFPALQLAPVNRFEEVVCLNITDTSSRMTAQPLRSSLSEKLNNKQRCSKLIYTTTYPSQNGYCFTRQRLGVLYTSLHNIIEEFIIIFSIKWWLIPK